MPTFTLHFDDDGIGVDKRVEFDAANPALVFSLLEADRPCRQAALWSGNKPIGTLRRNANGVWQLAGLPSHKGANSAEYFVASEDGELKLGVVS